MVATGSRASPVWGAGQCGTGVIATVAASRNASMAYLPFFCVVSTSQFKQIMGELSIKQGGRDYR
jgi:hypothetical protein